MFFFTGEEGPENENGPTATKFTDGGGFTEISYGEQIGSGPHQATDNWIEAMPIGLGFDHGDIGEVVGQSGANAGDVGFESTEINLDPCSNMRRNTNHRELLSMSLGGPFDKGGDFGGVNEGLVYELQERRVRAVFED